jgi:hypothetical protein
MSGMTRRHAFDAGRANVSRLQDGERLLDLRRELTPAAIGKLHTAARRPAH